MSQSIWPSGLSLRKALREHKGAPIHQKGWPDSKMLCGRISVPGPLITIGFEAVVMVFSGDETSDCTQQILQQLEVSFNLLSGRIIGAGLKAADVSWWSSASQLLFLACTDPVLKR